MLSFAFKRNLNGELCCVYIRSISASEGEFRWEISTVFDPNHEESTMMVLDKISTSVEDIIDLNFCLSRFVEQNEHIKYLAWISLCDLLKCSVDNWSQLYMREKRYAAAVRSSQPK